MFASIAIRLMSALLSSRNLPPLRVRIICGKFPFRARCCGGWGQPPSREGACPHAPPNRGDRLACIKRERTVSFMHSREARPKARTECMKKQCAQWGASSLTCRSVLRKIGRISLERLVSVDAKFSSARRVWTSHELWIASASRTQTLKNPNTQTPLRSVFRTMFPRRAFRLARGEYYIKNLGGRGALFAAGV